MDRGVSGKHRKGGSTSLALGTAHKSDLMIQLLQRKHKRNLCYSLPAHSLQPCHSMLSQRESRSVPSKVAALRISSHWSWWERLWCRGPGIQGPPDSLQLALFTFLVWNGELGAAGPHTLLGQAAHWGHSASSFSFQHEARKQGSLPAAPEETPSCSLSPSLPTFLGQE